MPFDAEITPKSSTLILLEKAREINRKGWCAHSLYKEGNENHCMAGALNIAHHGHWDYNRLVSGYQLDYFKPVAEALGFEAADSVPDQWAWIHLICDWNNAQVSVEPILARYDAAIAKLSALEGVG